MSARLSPFATAGEALRHQAKVRPDAEALAFPLSGGRLSFSAWLDEASDLAAHRRCSLWFAEPTKPRSPKADLRQRPAPSPGAPSGCARCSLHQYLGLPIA